MDHVLDPLIRVVLIAMGALYLLHIVKRAFLGGGDE